MEIFYDYIEKGGIIFSILLAMSAVGITLITYKFIEINLKAGDHVYDFNEFPKGIILINKGILRLVGKNSNNELLSIDKFKEEDTRYSRTNTPTP